MKSRTGQYIGLGASTFFHPAVAVLLFAVHATAATVGPAGYTNGFVNNTGTNATNPGSVMKLTFAATNATLLEFVARSNIAYSIQFRTNLVSGAWNNLTNLSAQTQTRTVQVNAVPLPPLRERYFRVVTPPVP